MARHFPAEQNGCYYGRVADCCWLCYFRLLGAAVKARLRV
ncbi:hypothetical protein SY89_03079 [Halolamina pelagica]|uniref:Uncharacterized protein n=1 Tax=Halolamina pelagica TaxID=699431 RepID=A0A0P7GDQ6_9EURY|nr:hypothetical protein SY89_03079 [Halolamina pelagica]